MKVVVDGPLGLPVDLLSLVPGLMKISSWLLCRMNRLRVHLVLLLSLPGRIRIMAWTLLGTRLSAVGDSRWILNSLRSDRKNVYVGCTLWSRGLKFGLIGSLDIIVMIGPAAAPSERISPVMLHLRKVLPLGRKNGTTTRLLAEPEFVRLKKTDLLVVLIGMVRSLNVAVWLLLLENGSGLTMASCSPLLDPVITLRSSLCMCAVQAWTIGQLCAFCLEKKKHRPTGLLTLVSMACAFGSRAQSWPLARLTCVLCSRAPDSMTAVTNSIVSSVSALLASSCCRTGAATLAGSF